MDPNQEAQGDAEGDGDAEEDHTLSI